MKMLISAAGLVALVAMMSSAAFAAPKMSSTPAYYGGTSFGQDSDLNIVGSLEREAGTAVGN